MGAKAEEKLEISHDELRTYLMANHSVYMDVDGHSYYLSDVNDRYWRVQDTTKFNEKNHYVDCSELVPTISEFLDLPFGEAGKSINELFDQATFYASIKK
ncbi:MAG: CDP-alcohol phosphatidyltransferase [Coriobacteriia bacterium]|nr:CDP-alcohol phosphatidyltransferase [Coriobacteriia bacterium]